MPFGDNSEAVDYLKGKHGFSATKISPRNALDLTQLQEHSKLSGERAGVGNQDLHIPASQQPLN